MESAAGLPASSAPLLCDAGGGTGADAGAEAGVCATASWQAANTAREKTCLLDVIKKPKEITRRTARIKARNGDGEQAWKMLLSLAAPRRMAKRLAQAPLEQLQGLGAWLRRGPEHHSVAFLRHSYRPWHASTAIDVADHRNQR
ncbi:hypothetical protein SDC9_200154 [bioreactor metagenome]|uniref:Uncharacterized protein n=1 Tax=bioreactor metagenome TaxID=1076179 RepID=A0A645INQ5_9ZZZZ